MFRTTSKGGGVLLVVLGGSFSKEWNFKLEQKEQNIWKVLGESDKRVGSGRNSNTRRKQGRGEALDQWARGSGELFSAGKNDKGEAKRWKSSHVHNQNEGVFEKSLKSKLEKKLVRLEIM